MGASVHRVQARTLAAPAEDRARFPEARDFLPSEQHAPTAAATAKAFLTPAKAAKVTAR